MSGGNCPETPRQKMIGMMYLFLTAMLALNVSGDLLLAFQLVDESIQESIKTTEAKNEQLIQRFDAAALANEQKVRPVREKVNAVHIAADELYNHIHDLKVIMMRTADKNPEATLDNYKGADNQDVAAQVMIAEKGGERSKELKAKIFEYKELVKSYVSTEDTMFLNTIEKSLSTEAKKPTKQGQIVPTWESQKFEHLPLSASFALLSSIQSNVRNTQADLSMYLLNSIDENSYKFNKIDGIVIPKSSIVIKGDTYSADLLIVATDEYQKPRFSVPGHSIKIKDNGRGLLEIPASSAGKKKWEGTIYYKDPNGRDVPYKVDHEYEVVEPNVVISPTKMNVFYEALENPVEISVPGVSSSQLDVRFSNATAQKRGDVYIVKPKSGFAGGKSIVTVYADINGNRQRLGSKEFRIKPLPLPFATFAGKREGKVRKNLMISQSGVFAEMGDDFDFELKYKITQFTIGTFRNGFYTDEPGNGNRLSDEQIELLRGTSRGSKVFIENIKAIGPDGRNRKLASITLTID